MALLRARSARGRGHHLYAFGTFPLVNIGTQVMLGAQRARQQFALWNACRLSVPVLYLGTIVALAVAHRLSVGSAMLALYTATWYFSHTSLCGCEGNRSFA